jgi:hypothetical protein
VLAGVADAGGGAGGAVGAGAEGVEGLVGDGACGVREGFGGAEGWDAPNRLAALGLLPPNVCSRGAITPKSDVSTPGGDLPRAARTWGKPARSGDGARRTSELRSRGERVTVGAARVLGEVLTPELFTCSWIARLNSAAFDLPSRGRSGSSKNRAFCSMALPSISFRTSKGRPLTTIARGSASVRPSLPRWPW